MAARQALRRYHIWLGWVVGLPILLWTLSGLVMVARPIEEVRGEHLVKEPARLPDGVQPVPPAIGPRPVDSLTLRQQAAGSRWIIQYADGAKRLADPRSGRLLPDLTAAEAVREVEALYQGTSSVSSVRRTHPDDPPLDLRRQIGSWAVTMADGTRFYVDAASGEIVARRTPFWRFYDLMWGLHIMDLETREDSHNPLVIGFAALSLVATILALVLLPMTLRRRR